MIATAPGKLILTGEYAVLDGAAALVIAVDRRVVARTHRGPRGTAPFLVAVADELASRYGADHPATRAAMSIVVDSTTMFDGTQKLGLGSSAAVTVAATALALAAEHHEVPLPKAEGSEFTSIPVIDRELVASIAHAAHANAQQVRGARGSGADIAAAVHGGTISFLPAGADPAKLERLPWPAGVTLLPFFTGTAANTPELVARVAAARAANPAAVNAALTAIGDVSRAACQACAVRTPEIAANALLAALALAAQAIDRLAIATAIPLVPSCVIAARTALTRLGGTAKTTGAGGGDVAIGVIPATQDAALARRLLREAGCQPLALTVDNTGVDLQPDAQ